MQYVSPHTDVIGLLVELRAHVYISTINESRRRRGVVLSRHTAMLNPAAAAVGLSRYLDGGSVRMCKARLAFDTSGGKSFDISISVATF